MEERNVDRAGREGDVAFPTIRVTLVPDLLRLGHKLLMKTIDVFVKTNCKVKFSTVLLKLVLSSKSDTKFTCGQ